jgi:ABC-type dipeptide/oligopeptide/nickel transport system permease subunit
MTYQADVNVAVDEATLERDAAPPGRSLTALAIRRLTRKKLAMISLAIILIIYVCGLGAPFVAPYGYSEQNLDKSFQGPSLDHPFGTDRNGRDMFSRTVYAARTTVVVTLATVATGGILLPLTLGMLAGYRRGLVDSAIMRAGEILASLPGLPMLVLINASMRPRFVDWVEDLENKVGWAWLTDTGFADYFLIFFVLSLFGWVGGARLIRTQVLTLRGSEYVLAARASGASTAGILFRHMLPNIMPLVIVGLSASLGGIALAEVGLTFLGVGIQPPHPSFGALISDGAPRTVLENHPQLLLVPASVVAALVFAFNLLGDAVNDVLTPRAR